MRGIGSFKPGQWLAMAGRKSPWGNGNGAGGAGGSGGGSEPPGGDGPAAGDGPGEGGGAGQPVGLALSGGEVGGNLDFVEACPARHGVLVGQDVTAGAQAAGIAHGAKEPRDGEAAAIVEGGKVDPDQRDGGKAAGEGAHIGGGGQVEAETVVVVCGDVTGA